jgi:hypothetical protein
MVHISTLQLDTPQCAAASCPVCSMAEIMCMQVRLLDDQVMLQMLSEEQQADAVQRQCYNSSKHHHTQAQTCLRPTVHVYMTLHMH